MVFAALACSMLDLERLAPAVAQEEAFLADLIREVFVEKVLPWMRSTSSPVQLAMDNMTFRYEGAGTQLVFTSDIRYDGETG